MHYNTLIHYYCFLRAILFLKGYCRRSSRFAQPSPRLPCYFPINMGFYLQNYVWHKVGDVCANTLILIYKFPVEVFSLQFDKLILIQKRSQSLQSALKRKPMIFTFICFFSFFIWFSTSRDIIIFVGWLKFGASKSQKCKNVRFKPKLIFSSKINILVWKFGKPTFNKWQIRCSIQNFDTWQKIF